MTSIISVNPLYEALVREHRLDQFDEVMHTQAGQEVRRRGRRAVTQLKLLDAGRPVRLFLKRDWCTQWKDRFRNWIQGLGWGTKTRREWRAIQAVRAAGVGCPEPLIFAERGGIRPHGYLILLEIPAAVELKRYLAERRLRRNTQFRRQLAAHLGHEVARLHEAGIDHPDLYSKHVFLSHEGQAEGEVKAEGGGRKAEAEADLRFQISDCREENCGSENEFNPQSAIRNPRSGSDSAFRLPPSAFLPRVFFIDMQRSSIRRSVSLGHRVRDLAALDSTLARELASATDRLVFLQSYLSHARVDVDIRRLVALIRRRSSWLNRRAKIRAMRRIGRELALGLSESAKSL